MTGKELLGHLDDMELCIDIGAGDTVFHGHGGNGEYFLDFNLLGNPVSPGETVDIELCKTAKTYLSLAFSNIESLKVFSEFVAEIYHLAQDAESKDRESDGLSI